MSSCAALTLMCAATHVRAQRTVLHEFVADVADDELERALATDASSGDTSAASGEAELDGRAMTATAGDGIGPEGPGQRSPTFRPDRDTELEASLSYQEVFNPAIAPFKRVTSLDRTQLDADGRTPVLDVSVTERKRVPIEGGALAADPRPRDRFEGEVMLDFSQGRVVPLPSVSPESRILSVHCEPALELAIERDGADNFFALASGALPAAQVKLRFVTDAPRTYFGGAIPHLPVAALAEQVPALDAGLRARALGFAAELGIGPHSDLASAVSALTAYFRAFEESQIPPPDTGDIYLDLAHGKKGICRHRAYAFVVTAHALGIPARFVQNEAHSWVEIKLPKLGFRRIDLGGAASGMRTAGLERRSLYRSAEPDRLPRPAAYERSYSLAGRQPDAEGGAVATGAAGRWLPDAAPSAGPGLLPLLEAARGARPRAELRLSLDQSDANVLRGRALRVRGHVEDDAGAGVAGLRIEVSLSAEHRREHMLLGVTVSDARGAFSAAFDVPADLDVGDYGLRLLTPGDEHYLPAVAE